MKNVTMQYGSQFHNVSLTDNATVGSALADGTARIVLGYSDNVHGLIGGVPQSNDTVLPGNVTLVVENKANEKAK